MATGGIHLPVPARGFLTQRGWGGEGHRRQRRPLLRAVPLRVPRGPLGRCRPHLACWRRDPRAVGAPATLRPLEARGSSRCECKCACHRVPAGGSSGKGTRRKVASASGGQGGRGPSRSRHRRPELRRGCAQDAFQRRSSLPPVGSGTSFGTAISSASSGRQQQALPREERQPRKQHPQPGRDH